MQAEYLVCQSSVTGVVGIPSDAAVIASLRPGVEIELLALGNDDVLYLRHGDEVVECQVERRSSWRLHDACLERSRGRLCVVRHVQSVEDVCLVTVGLRLLGPQLQLERLQLVVDQRIYEEVGALDRSASSKPVVHAWLAQRLLLPRLGSSGKQRILCGRGASSEATGALGRSFSLIGEGLRADVRLRESLTTAGRLEYAIERVATVPSGRVPPIMAIAEADVTFVDVSEFDSVRAAVDSQLTAIMGDDSTFLGMWKRYQEAEVELRLRRANEIGSMPYCSCTDLGDGRYRLVVAREHIGKARIETGSEIGILSEERTPESLASEFRESIGKKPQAVLDGLGEKRDAPETRKCAEILARVEAIEQGGLHLVVRCGEGFVPSAQGHIGASIMGDIVGQKRRAEALQQIADGSAAMDQLGLIIDESGPLTQRRRRSERPVTPKLIDRVFTDEKGRSWRPTAGQKKAIFAALNTPDIAVIQGPPGTGKTTVMRAIIERIHELNGEDPSRGERFLVTGYQHDAVENAIEKLAVNGLPAMKIGTRRSDHGASTDDEESRLDQFVEGLVASSTVLSRGSAVLHEDLRAIEDELAACIGRPLSPAAAALALRSISDRFGTRLSRGLQEQIIDLAERFEDDASPTLDEETVRLERAIRAIRCTAVAFADDGARNASHALALLERRGPCRGLALLQSCAGWSSPEAPAFLGEVEELRLRLLLKYGRRVGTEAIAVVSDEFLALLEAAREEIRMRVERIATADGLALARFRDSLEDRTALREAIRHYTAVIASTCQQAVSKSVAEYARVGADGLRYDTVLCDEAARANPLDLLIPMTRAERRIVLVGDHRQLPHVVEAGIEDLLFGEDAELCDDSAKTGKDRVAEALKESLFERVFRVLRERERMDNIPRVVTLDEQFRMHPRLGQFVSEQFYPVHERFKSPLDASQFAHRFAGYAGRCAAWHDVPGEPEAKVGYSRMRRAEAQQIARLLKPMLEQAIEERSDATFGVITFYSAQVKAIEEELVRAGVMVRQEGGTPRCSDRYIGRLRVGTVDAFQGREFDVVFLSVVRSNEATKPQRKFGHLMSANRMCVSMSRQKKLLIVVGDRAMLRDPMARESIPALLEFDQIARSEEAAVRTAGASA